MCKRFRVDESDVESGITSEDVPDFSSQHHSATLAWSDATQGELDLRGLDFRRLSLDVAGNSWNNTAPTTPVSFEVALPPDILQVTFELREGTQAQVTLIGLPESAYVHVVGPRRASPCRLVLHETPAKSIHVIRARLDVDALETRTKSHRAAISLLEVVDGELQVSGRNVNVLKCSGWCVVEMTNTPVGKLRTEPRTKLRINTRECRVKVHDGTVDASSGEPFLILESGSDLAVDQATSSHVAIQEGARIRVSKASDLTVRGPGTFVVGSNADRLNFASPPARLVALRHSAIVSARGEVVLQQVTDCSIVGISLTTPRDFADHTNSLIIADVESADSSLSGASLSEFALPVSLGGLSTISRLDKHAQHASPLIHGGLPGLGALSGLRLSAYLKPKLSETELLVRAEYSRSLADLARSKGASASVRTTLSWARYRMRSIVAPRRTERWLLAAYRVLGYGERFVPPLLLFAVLVLFFNVLSLRHESFALDPGSIRYFLRNLLDWALTPLHLLRLTEPDVRHAAFSEPWDTLARLLIAIPFGTAILVMRKFVKEDDDAP